MTTRLPPRPRNLSDVIDRLDKLDSDSLLFHGRLEALEGEITSLRQAPRHPFRDPEASVHDFDEDVARFRENLRVTARRDSVRARQIAVEAVKAAERDGKAARWDKLVQTGWKVLVGVLVGVLVTVIVYRFGMR